MALLIGARLSLLFLLISPLCFAQKNLSTFEISHLLSKSKNGDAESQIKLGFAYQYGTGVPQDLELAEKWYKTAAGFGNPVAQTLLGVLYLQPTMRQQHAKDASQWFLRAAASQYAPAEYSLGLLYHRGWGVRVDEEESERWYRKALKHGYRPAVVNLALHLLQSNLSENEEEVFKLLTQASKDGTREAWSLLGFCYEKGVGVKQDFAQAAKWYMKSAKAGMVDGMHNIGVLLFTGVGIQKNYQEAFRWESRACDEADLRGCALVANFYLNGYGVKQDRSEAYRYALIASPDGRLLAALVPSPEPDRQLLAMNQAEEWKRAHALQLSTLGEDNTPNLQGR